MTDVTLEDVAKRLTELEGQVAILSGKSDKDWRRTVGMFEGSEFAAQADADVLAAREAEREEARAGRME